MSGPSAPMPPGPANLVGSTLAFQRTPLTFLGGVFAKYGDVATVKLATNPVVVLRHPYHAKRVMQERNANYVRDTKAHKMARQLFGDGVSTLIGGEPWRRRRRLLQPAFHHERVRSLTTDMLAAIQAMLDRWEASASSGSVVDLSAEMRALTLRIVARSLFGLRDETTLRRFAGSVESINRELTAYMRFPLVPLRVPTPGHRRFWNNVRLVDEIVKEVIDGFDEGSPDNGDLLWLIVRARDADGDRLSRAELRDEVFTMLFAGHETSANTLGWLWYHCVTHPDVGAWVQDEVDRVLGSGPPSVADVGELVYTKAVVDETLRLYPQGWQGWRHAQDEDEIGGYRISAGADLLVSPYHIHRHPDFWKNPEVFDPERFLPRRIEQHDRNAYLPFGAGPHMCIGNQFAQTEIILAVASAVQRYRITPVPGLSVSPAPLLTLGTDRPILVHVESRH